MDEVFVLLFFMIVVGIPVIGGIGSNMFSRWLKHKEQMAGALNAQTAERAAQYAAHTERLEQRVRVLERIATDRGTDLSHEIERLRDAPPAALPHLEPKAALPHLEPKAGLPHLKSQAGLPPLN